MTEYIIEEYVTVAGKCPFGDWFQNLPVTQAEKVQDAVVRMEHGNLGKTKPVGEGVIERKLVNPALRLYFGRDGDRLIILLCGGGKKRQDADIAYAKRLWAEYKERKKAEKTRK